MTKIPFNYAAQKMQKLFSPEDINRGVASCRRLGFDPYAIELGQHELKQLEGWMAGTEPFVKTGAKEDSILNIRLIKADFRYRCIFHCKSWMMPTYEKKASEIISKWARQWRKDFSL